LHRILFGDIYKLKCEPDNIKDSSYVLLTTEKDINLFNSSS